MLNPALKLNDDVFNDDVLKAPTRAGYGTGVVAAGDENENVVVLSADLTGSTHADKFAKKFPERFFQVGVAEQNMATVAAGLGTSGKIPFISSYATFSPGRNWEQIRTTISYNDSNVKIAGHHSGIYTGPDGATHQATEDLATTRVMANMRVFYPCDSLEAHRATLAAAKVAGPVYLRFAREKTPIITTEETPFKPGVAEIFWKSKKPQCTIIGAGPFLYTALRAAKELEEKHKIQTQVLNVHTIKPLDEKGITKAAAQTGAVVTVEDHTVLGGLGGAVAELLARELPTPMEFVGLQDVFGESGSPTDIIKKFNMDVPDIVAAAKKVIARKK